MKKRTWLASALAILAATMLTACGGDEKTASEFDSKDAAKAALNQAQTIYIEGDNEAVTQKSDILADDKVAAHLDGWTVSINGETWFRIDFVTDEWINEDGEDYSAGNTYGYYDADGKCFGYAQNRGYSLEDGEYTYNYYFMDAEGNLKSYYIDENGREAFDDEGNVIATAEWDADFKLSLSGGDFHIQIDKAEGAAIDMDFTDKMVMYIRLFSENR